MIFTASQIVAHLIGDYLIQSHWMAVKKRANWSAAIWHGWAYSLAFVAFCGPSIPALLIIAISHMIFDHYGVSRYVVFAKNFLAPRAEWPTWADSKKTGYPSNAPDFLAVWLNIIADNILHLIVNALALQYL